MIFVEGIEMLELSHAPKILKHDVDGVDVPGSNIDVRRIRAMRERADEQTVATGCQRVKGESAQAVGNR